VTAGLTARTSFRDQSTRLGEHLVERTVQSTPLGEIGLASSPSAKSFREAANDFMTRNSHIR
jgi:hypothetical protein